MSILGYLLVVPFGAWINMLLAGWLHASVWEAVPTFGYGAALVLSLAGLVFWFLLGLVIRGLGVIFD